MTLRSGSLSGEELGKLAIIDVMLVRHEVPTFADLVWLAETLDSVNSEYEELESNHTNESDADDERIEQAETKLEEALQRCAELEEDRNHWKATAMIREAASKFEPERLLFLQRSLRASLESVEIAMRGGELPTPKKATVRKGQKKKRAK
jgi:hypothetical protein